MALFIDQQRVILNHDTRLYPHHVDLARLYDFSVPVAEVNQHPTNAAIWGLKNLTSDAWKVTLADGKTLDVISGKSVTLQVGTRIAIGRVIGRIEWAAKRAVNQ